MSLTVTFTNLGSGTCELAGNARFEFLGSDGATIVGRPAGVGGGFGDLKPNATVKTDLRIGITEQYDVAKCQPAPVSAIRVQPPGDTALQTIASPISSACKANVEQFTLQIDATPMPYPS